MSAFDLIFITSALATIGALMRVLYLLARGRGAQALRMVLRWSLAATVYAVLLVIVSLAQPQRVVPMGKDQCFDDWCIAVDSAAQTDTLGAERATGTWLVVTARVRSHMRGRAQSEPDAYGYLLDSAGHRIDVSARGEAVLERAGRAGQPLGSMLEPDGEFLTRLAFDVPRNPRSLGFVKERRARFPGIIIIGDATSVLHKRTIVPVSPVETPVEP